MTNSTYYTNVTKIQMIAELNDILARYYGVGTTISKKAAKLSRERILAVHQAVWYWRNDTLAEQVKTLNEWLAAAL